MRQALVKVHRPAATEFLLRDEDLPLIEEHLTHLENQIDESIRLVLRRFLDRSIRFSALVQLRLRLLLQDDDEFFAFRFDSNASARSSLHRAAPFNSTRSFSRRVSKTVPRRRPAERDSIDRLRTSSSFASTRRKSPRRSIERNRNKFDFISNRCREKVPYG